MKVVICLCLIAMTVAIKNYTCPNNTKIEGFPRKFTWIGYDWTLLTFQIFSNECINKRDVIVTTYEVGDFEAFIMTSIKNISCLPIEIYKKFPKLLIYDANNCAVEKVTHENFKNLIKLKDLKLNRNYISSIDNDSFKDLENLRELFLNDNQIQEIDHQIFKPLKNLRHLQLDNNKISFIEKKAFKHLLKLEHILIGRNFLKTLNDEHFKSNKKLITIWLENNDILVLNSTMFDHLANLKYIDLKYNVCIDDYYIEGDFVKMRKLIENDCKHFEKY
ncbi:unnamed protein product [Chironomus riparius]|uniref:Uncharacterized protein n=1 Tax=Chironomus riparius TaxID=315576 RepID=A0A9N9S2S6_9DIPT|nr:unnamed protein product [Chironomus riparius]